MSDSTRIEFPARDGVTLRGNFYRAQGEGAPIAVMATGFSLLKETNSGFARAIRNAGISVLAFDYKSFGSSDGLPRQEINLYRQSEDMSDAVTAARGLPGVDTGKVIAWGVGHGAGSAMMVAGNDPRVAAAALHIPFVSGAVDAAGYPNGLLARAWEDLENKTRVGDTSPTYAKVFRDWAEDGGGDEGTVFIKGPAGYHFYAATMADSAATGTPWENQVTLRSFLNVAGTEIQSVAYKVKCPTMYVVNEDDPLAASTEFQRKVFERMGPNVGFKEIPSREGKNLGDQLAEGCAFLIDWVRTVV